MFRFERDTLRARPATAYVEDRAIRFQDVDAAGIIFYPRLLEYCHDLLARFFSENGAALPEVLREGNWLAPVRHAEVDYFKPLRFGDPVEVALVSAYLSTSEVTLGFRVARRDGSDEVCAVAQSVHTFVDAHTFTRIPLPDALRAGLEAIGNLARPNA
jgi:YbgC/YbaW family acyl-CoA thioester hydrolase